MELREGLEEMQPSRMTDDLDELRARIRLGVLLGFHAVAAMGIIMARWVLNLEGRLG